MTDWQRRLTEDLEPILRAPDPRPAISAYHDMPYAIFLYPPEEEYPLRQQVALLRTRLEQSGKRVTTISLAECMRAALEAEGLAPAALAEAEIRVGLPAAIDTITEVLSTYQPLDRLVAARLPADADPLRDVVFIVRTGALFPVYRTCALLDQLTGQLCVPAVLFYPGTVDGANGLSFMGVLDPDPNYRPRIF